MKISACMIAMNEENNIARCINSYKDIVDEIIVVDTGSTDMTVEIARNLGAQIYKFKWENDFAKARNYALSKANGDWIIFLDADEYFEEKSAKKIPQILKGIKNTNFNAVGCKIINIDKNKGGKVQGSFLNIRIFKRSEDIKYIGNIHERISNFKGKINIAAYYQDIIIYHTGYSTDINKEKARRNLEILLENINKEGEKAEYYHYLSDCYLTLGEYEKAVKYARLQISSGKKFVGSNTKYYINIIKSLYYLNAPREEIENEIKSAINAFPDHPNFYLSYADFLFEEKRYEEALANYLKFFKCKEEYNGIEADHTEGFVDSAYFKAAFILQLKNNERIAMDYYYKSLERDKYSSEKFQAFFYIIKQQEPDEIINLLNKVYDINSEKDVGFLVDEFIIVKHRDLLGYYTNIWYKKFGNQDRSLLITLLLSGKYQTCFNIFYNGYKNDGSNENCIYAVISAMLSNVKENIILIKGSAKSSLKRIIEVWEHSGEMLTKNDMEDYLELFKELIFIDSKKAVLNSYMNLRNSFSDRDKPELLFKMAKILQDCFLFEEAVMLYQDCLNMLKENNSYLKIVNMLLGYCLYKLENFKSACDHFKKAMEHGYMENDIKEFLCWTQEQTSEQEIKNLTRELINQYSKRK